MAWYWTGTKLKHVEHMNYWPFVRGFHKYTDAYIPGFNILIYFVVIIWSWSTGDMHDHFHCQRRVFWLQPPSLGHEFHAPFSKCHENIMTWKCFPHYYWLFVRGFHQWLVDSPHKGPVMLSYAGVLLLVSTTCWTNSGIDRDLRHHNAYVMSLYCSLPVVTSPLEWQNVCLQNPKRHHATFHIFVTKKR